MQKIMPMLTDSHKNDVTSIFRDRLRRRMDARGISCCALARTSEVPEKTLRNILQGIASDPRISTFWRIAQALGGDANDLLGFAPAGVQHIVNSCEANSCKETVAALRQRLRNSDAEIQRLNAQLHESGVQIGEHRQCCAAWQKEAEHLRGALDECIIRQRRARLLSIACGVLLVAALVVMIYVLWDATHLDKGFFRK